MTVLACIGGSSALFAVATVATFRGVPAAAHLCRSALRRTTITQSRGGHRK